MHDVVVPFAAPLPEAGRDALRGVAWPQLAPRLVASSRSREVDEPTSLSPPHERALARLWGWQGGDGCLPFAARAARGDGIDPGDAAWGLVTPVHWQLGADQITLADPAELALDEAASRRLFDAARPLFAGEGFELRWGAPGRWYLSHPSLAGLASASLDRAVGRGVDRWLGFGPRWRPLRRLQNEVQMIWHTDPVNAEREARGLPVVNSFWLSGCGVAQPEAADVRVDERLRSAALAGDWPAWTQACRALDGELAAAAPVRVTLCGERGWLRFEVAPRGPLGRLLAGLARVDLAQELQAL